MLKKIASILISIGVLCIFFGCNIDVFGIKINNKTNPKLTAKDKLRLQDFKIGGLYLEQPISEVIKILGKPIKVEIKDINSVILQYYYFSGVVIGVLKSEQKVIQLRIENKNYKTFRGIGVGSKEQDVYYFYGKARKMNDMINYTMVAYQKPVEVSYKPPINVYYVINFFVSNGKVTKVYYDYAPEE